MLQALCRNMLKCIGLQGNDVSVRRPTAEEILEDAARAQIERRLVISAELEEAMNTHDADKLKTVLGKTLPGGWTLESPEKELVLTGLAYAVANGHANLVAAVFRSGCRIEVDTGVFSGSIRFRMPALFQELAPPEPITLQITQVELSNWVRQALEKNDPDTLMALFELPQAIPILTSQRMAAGPALAATGPAHEAEVPIMDMVAFLDPLPPELWLRGDADAMRACLPLIEQKTDVALVAELALLAKDADGQLCRLGYAGRTSLVLSSQETRTLVRFFQRLRWDSELKADLPAWLLRNPEVVDGLDKLIAVLGERGEQPNASSYPQVRDLLGSLVADHGIADVLDACQKRWVIHTLWALKHRTKHMTHFGRDMVEHCVLQV